MLEASSLRRPKFGYLFVEERRPGARRPKLVVSCLPKQCTQRSSRFRLTGDHNHTPAGRS